MGRLLRAAQRGLSQTAKLQGKDLVRWKYNRYMHDYLGCIKAVDESVGRLLDYLDERGLARRTRSSSTPPTRASTWASTAGSTSAGSSRNRCARRSLVRWPGVVKPGQHERRPRLEPRLRRDVSRRRRPAGARRDAGPQPRAAPEGRDARRLAEELLLPLLRVSRRRTTSARTTAW